MPIAIHAENIAYSYQNNHVLEDINFEIQQGDYVGIIGPNGGGKTTLLKIITALLKPHHGKISVFGESPEKARKRGKIGYVPQRIVQSNIQCPATVEEVVSSGRITKDLQAVQRSMLDAEVAHLSARSIDSLSGGERQRVFIARALAADPMILILDEPTTGVDIKASKNFYTLLKHLNLEHGLTIIVVSHDLEAVSREVNSVLCLNKKLISTCRHEELIHKNKEILEALYGPDKNFMHHHHH